MTTLLVGGDGFIGRRLTETLAQTGEPVVCFDLDPAPAADESVTVVAGDVTDAAAVTETFDRHNPDRVVHLAYLLGAESDQSPSRAVRVNCVGSDNVFRAAVEHGADRVVYASSIGVYGPPEGYDGPIVEDAVSPAAYTAYPLLFYSATKQLTEYQARLYADRGSTEFAAIRPSIVFGPGREGGLTQWASNIVTGPVHGEPVHLPFGPDQPLGLIYRDDVVDLTRELLAAEVLEHHAYNTGGVMMTAQELADAVTGEVGGEVTFEDGAERLPLVADVSHERAAKEFGYTPTPLVEAIRRHADEVA